MNYRWSQTKRTERNRQEELYLEGLYPFANVPTFDPISSTSDWRYKKCEETHTCPLAMEFYSANEYWVKAGSLMSTDPSGTFRPAGPSADPALSAVEQAAWRRRQSDSEGPVPAVPQSARLRAGPARAVDRSRRMVDARRAAARLAGAEASRRHAGAAAAAGRRGIPAHPGVTYTGLKTTRYRFNYGPNFYQTFIPTINPPVITPPYEDNPANGPIYPSYVPKTDEDGNDIAGIRLPELTVPLATYTGWGLRSGVWANDGCEASGQYIPFAATKAARIAAGDPRPRSRSVIPPTPSIATR